MILQDPKGPSARGAVILLTDQELEPYHIYDRQPHEAGHIRYAGSFSDLAKATWHLYPGVRPPAQVPPAPATEPVADAKIG